MLIKCFHYWSCIRKEVLTLPALYYDTKTRQYRHRFNCEDCGELIGCYCYSSIDRAFTDIEDGGHLCDRCNVKTFLRDTIYEDEYLLDEIDKIRGDKMVSGLVNAKTAVDDGLFDDAGMHDVGDAVSDAIHTAVFAIISSMPVEQLKAVAEYAINHTDYYDDCHYGDLCSSDDVSI